MKLLMTVTLLVVAFGTQAQQTVKEKVKFMNAQLAKVYFIHVEDVSLDNQKRDMVRFTEAGFFVKYKGAEKKYLWKSVNDLDDQSVIGKVVIYFPGKTKDEEEEITFFISNEVAREYHDFMKALMVHNGNVLKEEEEL